MVNFKEVRNGILFLYLYIILVKKKRFISSYHWIDNLVKMVKWKYGLCVDGDLKFI
jgi:hypothetical protein